MPAIRRCLARSFSAKGENGKPTIDRKGPYRIFFYSNEGNEPPHVHIQHDDRLAKFSLEPVALQGSSGFSAHELNTLEKLVAAESGTYMEKWHEYFG